MLRASNSETGVDRLAHEAELEAFATAVARGADDVADHRDRLCALLGDAAFAEAAAVTAAFHGYVRVAEGTGIPVDELVVATSAISATNWPSTSSPAGPTPISTSPPAPRPTSPRRSTPEQRLCSIPVKGLGATGVVAGKTLLRIAGGRHRPARGV